MKHALTTILAAALFLTAAIRINAATITVTRPIQTSEGPALDTFVNDALNDAVANAAPDLAKYDNQSGLAKGFGNANAFSSHAGNFNGYQNYNIFAVSIGSMLGLQAPNTDVSYYNPDSVREDLESDGDMYAGFAAGASINAGIHLRFITSGLYLTAVFGQIELGSEADYYRFKNTTYGMRINYSLSYPRSIMLGLFKWRGFSFGTGLLYQKNELSFEQEVSTVSDTFDDGAGNTGTVTVDPTVRFGIISETYTVPLEIVTAFQLFWFLNITAGAGVDVIQGSSDIVLNAAGDVNVSFSSGSATVTQPGQITVDGSTSNVSPSRYRPKLMTGIGFSIFMVKIDFPIVYYPSAGAAVGFTAGIVF